ncbi:hypothetical protein CROQUDRAFT_713353 [Cronartium quercuum f. sp. fusiforme G11]|uniref:Large ribosomal subunit protein mL44 n=1 Tax=Cronartium quercuum f. sp. fusiforme G11 TaxID=708437 RepID=A0A9P6NR38_9BASI|nr:hypothetical protein CROQUDRAFT_713353 [Cronartium quercuum f. sp. fusiforme G11]
MGGRRLCGCIRKTLINQSLDKSSKVKFSTTTTTTTKNSITGHHSDLLYKPLNKIRPPSNTTSNAYLHKIHDLLYPPPPSAIAAFAHRIPKLPKEILSSSNVLKSIEQCLVSPTFWKGIELGDVKLEDLKKSISEWKISKTKSNFEETSTKSTDDELFLPGKLTKVIQPDQSMDANQTMHPFGSERRKKLKEQKIILNSDLDQLSIDPNWKNNYPKFTNYLDIEKLHNDELANLGNSLLGLFGTEWIHKKYPHLPNKAFQAALTMFVGPRTCADISRLWGVSSGIGLSNLTIEQKPKINSTNKKFAGGLFDLDGKLKNKKQSGQNKFEEKSEPGLLRWRRLNEQESSSLAFNQGILYEDAMASVSRALVGLVYNHSGIGPTREFVRTNWFSRKAQVGDLLKFTNPFLVLKYTLAKYNREPPVARLLRESGRASATAMFVVGSYSGPMKLGEAYGTSMKMAEYRAHEDALRRIYLSSSSPTDTHLPSDTLIEPAGFIYSAPIELGDLEVEEASAVNRSGRMAEVDVEEVLGRRKSLALQSIGLAPVGSTMALSSV